METDSLPDNLSNPNSSRLPVTKQAKREYLQDMRSRYRAASRKEQTKLLDEMVQVCQMNRKYLIRVLNRKRLKLVAGAGTARRVGRPKEYDGPEIVNFLVRVWHASNQACSKRLKSVLHLWLGAYADATGIVLTLEHQVLLLRMSHSTIDRLLTNERRKYRVGKGRAITKPGTLLKKRIPVKTNQWDEDRPGFLEVDTVGHCGTSTAGMYVLTLNTVDIATGWVEPRAVWGKGEKGVVEAVRDIEAALPFSLRGFDVDNGGEVLNHHMETYLTGRKRPAQYTRSREYRKNDNAHIEGRNWTHIRQYLGYERFDNPDVVPLMNDLYRTEYSLLVNYFLPSVKLQEKTRIGSKIIKRHDHPTTPCDRLMASRYISKDTKASLIERRASLNPFTLHASVHRKLKTILRLCSLRPNLQIAMVSASNPVQRRANPGGLHSLARTSVNLRQAPHRKVREQ